MLKAELHTSGCRLNNSQEKRMQENMTRRGALKAIVLVIAPSVALDRETVGPTAWPPLQQWRDEALHIRENSAPQMLDAIIASSALLTSLLAAGVGQPTARRFARKAIWLRNKFVGRNSDVFRHPVCQRKSTERSVLEDRLPSLNRPVQFVVHARQRIAAAADAPLAVERSPSPCAAEIWHDGNTAFWHGVSSSSAAEYR
jgi:hypothetical protein